VGSKKRGNHKKTSTNTESHKQSKACYRCGTSGHAPSQCKYKTYKCNFCKKQGHLVAVCREKNKSQGATNYVGESELSGTGTETNVSSNNVSANGQEQNSSHTCPCSGIMHDFDTLGLYHVDSNDAKKSSKPIMVQLTIANTPVQMEVDTGSAKTIIPETMFHDKFGHVKLQRAQRPLKTYSGAPLPLLGEAMVDVCYLEQTYTLPLVVAKVDPGQPAILGRNWLEYIKLDWENLFSANIMHVSELDSVLDKHSSLFKPGLGTMKHHTAVLYVKDNARPVFCKARPVPYALKERIEQEYARLQKEGIIVPVTHAEWASPVVPVQKGDGSIRICGDFKMGVNDALNVDKYPLPNPNDLFAALAGGKYFSKLDLSQAYQQMLLDEQSRKYVTVNTHMGLFQYTRLPYGIASAPSVFQATMEQILQGIDGVLTYLDDIMISGSSEREHLERLDLVMTRLENHGLRLKVSKCAFLQQRVEYLGHVIDSDGLHPTPSKIQAILHASVPKNVSELRSFLGMLQYYARFIQNLSIMLKPLHNLLQTDVKWKWTPECHAAFTEAQQALVSAKVLTHYDVNKPLKLACDASPYGVGAVLSHIMDNGEERPVVFASRTLTKTEQNYSQLEKEALALIFAVRKFHSYIYGRRFTLVTDHKPLVTIFGPKKGIPSLAAQRLQRWAIILSAHQYDIDYRSTHDHANCRCFIATSCG
jgi:hypothetical protein